MESRRFSVDWLFANKDDTFSEKAMVTAFVDYKTKEYKVGATTLSVELWDTAGQEKYAAVSSIYYKGADFVVMVYDLTNANSLNKLFSNWLRNVQSYASPDVLLYFVGFFNKQQSRPLENR